MEMNAGRFDDRRPFSKPDAPLLVQPIFSIGPTDAEYFPLSWQRFHTLYPLCHHHARLQKQVFSFSWSPIDAVDFEIVGFVHLIVKAVMFEHREHCALGATESMVEVMAPINASKALPTMDSWMSSRRILA